MFVPCGYGAKASDEKVTSIKQQLAAILAKYNGRPDIAATAFNDENRKGKKRKVCFCLVSGRGQWA